MCGEIVVSDSQRTWRQADWVVQCGQIRTEKKRTVEGPRWAGVAQSVQGLATGWTVRGSNPGGGESFLTRPDRPWRPPSLLYSGYRGLFPGGKAAGALR